jgi:hypothetical protein
MCAPRRWQHRPPEPHGHGLDWELGGTCLSTYSATPCAWRFTRPPPLARAGLAGFVAMEPRLREVPADRIGEADAIVVAVDVADAAVLDLLRSLCDKPGARFLVVVSKQWRADVSAARHRGVRAVV